MRRLAAILSLLCAVIFAAAYSGPASGWETVFEVHGRHGKFWQPNILETMMDPQVTVMIGIEVEGIRIGYDSRNGFGAVIDF